MQKGSLTVARGRDLEGGAVLTGQGRAPHQHANFRVDDEFATLIPPLTDEERRQLESNLVNDGCRDALVVWREEGLLLDGHHRLQICEQRGIAYKVTEISLSDRLEAKIWIRQSQAGKRNLSDSQRAMNAAALAELLGERAKRERARLGGHAKHGTKPPACLEAAAVCKQPKTTSRAAVARGARVSERKVRQAQEVRKADPDLAHQVEMGVLQLGAALKEVRRKKKAKAKATVPPDLPAATDRYRVVCGEFQRADVGIASADWIVTDPPYGKQFLSLYADLSEFAARVLKPGGSLLAMVGQSYLPEVVQLLGKHLTYHWTLVYETPGGQAVQLWEKKINTFWKPLLWYVKDRYGGDWVGDVCRSAPNDNDKRFHEWGQSESGMADIIDRFTYPGQTICDPFCGSGTTGVVAVRMNRLFIGIDRDGDAVATTLQRLAEVAHA